MDAPGPAVVAASESEYDSQEETEYYDEEEEASDYVPVQVDPQ